MSFIKHPFDSNCNFCKNKSSYPFDYSFIDIAYCINLKCRKDRFNYAVKEFHKYGLCQKVIFYITEKPLLKEIKEKKYPNRGTYGCWESHRAVIKHALSKNKNNCLVFEDDIVFHSPKYIKNYICRYNHLPKNWDIYYMGHSPFFGYPIGNNIYRTYSTGGHAYLINRKFMKKISKTPYAKWNFIGDIYAGIDSYHLKEGYCYSYYPMCAYQSGSTSDNNNQKEKEKIKSMRKDKIDKKIKKEQIREFITLKFLPIFIFILVFFILFLILI